MRAQHRKKYLPLCMAFAFLGIFILPQISLAKNILPQNPEEISWHISAQSVTFDNKRNLYIAEDDVIITGGKTRLEADYVEFSNQTKQAFAQGNVLFISGEDSISCNAMDINLATETGTISNGTIFIQNKNFYIHGENIKKTGQFTYQADKGSITSCSQEVPDWKISAKNIKVTIEGYGTADHAVLWAKKVPTIYSPYLIFPVQTKRQSGLLIPRVTSSDRKGFEYEQPLFIAISENTDATLYVDHMSDRGTKTGVEYRYVLDNKSKGAAFIDFLEDDKIDDGTKNSKNYSYDSTPQRTNTDRFWFRMKHDQDLGNGFSAKLDLDIVSDEDYLIEFQDGFTGYSQTNAYFEKAFGRSLDSFDSSLRKNWLNIYKSWSNYSFNADVLWYDNINARRQNVNDTTLQTLPAIEFDASKQRIGTSGFYYSLDSEYRSFYRKDTTATLVNGQRADVYPRISRPMRLGRYLSFEPYAGLRETIWHTSDFVDIHGNSDSFRTRETYDVGGQISTKLIKLFNPDNSFAEKAKHELVPKLEYVFSPHIDQDDLPSFDVLDRINEQNLLTWSLTNNFILRKTITTPRGEKIINYQEFAYVKLYQSYDIKKERDDESRPFSALFLELELHPLNYFSLNMDLSWSPYDSHFKTLNIGNTLSDNRGDTLTTEYRYTTDLSHSLYSRLNLSLTEDISAFYSIERNMITDRTVETQAGIDFIKACWTFRIFFSESRGENSIAFLINLHGIGEFGTK